MIKWSLLQYEGGEYKKIQVFWAVGGGGRGYSFERKRKTILLEFARAALNTVYLFFY
jgi:hypothetical protein